MSSTTLEGHPSTHAVCFNTKTFHTSLLKYKGAASIKAMVRAVQAPPVLFRSNNRVGLVFLWLGLGESYTESAPVGTANKTTK